MSDPGLLVHVDVPALGLILLFEVYPVLFVYLLLEAFFSVEQLVVSMLLQEVV